MDLAQFKKMLDAHGADKCMQIIFDNGRVWLTSRPKPSSNPKDYARGLCERDENGKIVFNKFSDLVIINEDRETVTYIEFGHGVDANTADKIKYVVENPIEGIQGLAFIPDGYSEEQEYFLRCNWDHMIA